MKLIKPSFKILEQKPKDIIIPADMEIGPKMWKEELLNSVYRQIEIAGRTCYKSEDKIASDSAAKFVERMVKSGHGAMLEHGTVYLKVPYSEHKYVSSFENGYYDDCIGNYRHNKYSKVIQVWEDDNTAYDYVTTNLRVLVENNWLMDLQYICEPTEHHEKKVTVHFILSRSIAQEFTRHRIFSYAMESQRYCNYSKDKFNNEITFIQPCWDYLKTCCYNGVDNFDGDYFEHSLREAESYYFKLLELGWKPQEAREVLPNACKTELIMTGFVSDWYGEYLIFDKQTGLLYERIHGKFPEELSKIDKEKYRIVEKGFFPLRCSNAAHSQASELAIPLREEFIKRNYIK